MVVLLVLLGALLAASCLLASRPWRAQVQRRYRRRAGRAGEAKVTQLLRGVVAQTPARLLIDVTLPTASGGTTQIDHILLTTSRIFVIEVKHWAGTIQADPQADAWEQASGGLQRSLPNPLQQNAAHLRVVRAHLARCLWASPNLLEYLVVGLVVCTGSAQPVGRWPRGVGDLVWLEHTLARASGATRLDAATLTRCAAYLEGQRLRPGRATDRRHLRNVQQWRRYATSVGVSHSCAAGISTCSCAAQ
jgi:Nuclease-related domain